MQLGRDCVTPLLSGEDELENEFDPRNLNSKVFDDWGSRLGSNMEKSIPKIKVCHKSKEFAILTAMMEKLNSQNVQSGVTSEQSISVQN